MYHKELMKMPLQDLLPELYGDDLVTEETQERIAHPRAVFIRKEANHLILQDVRVAVSDQPECLDRFLKDLQTLQPAMGLSQQIRGMHSTHLVHVQDVQTHMHTCTHTHLCKHTPHTRTHVRETRDMCNVIHRHLCCKVCQPT